jgi:TIR domain
VKIRSERAPLSKFIISYRRSDSDVFAGRVRDRLAARFGEDSVFIDVDNIPLGTDFRIHIQKELTKADAVLVVVGPRWLGASKGGRNRIMDSTDPVRIEVEAALSKGIPTFPILVGDTVMPKVEQLPESLKDFAFINAATVDTGRDFHRDLDRIIATLGAIVGLPLSTDGRAAKSSNAVASGERATRLESSRTDTDRTDDKSRYSSKALAATISGLVLFGVLFGTAWWLWASKTRNLTAVNAPPQLAELPNVNAQHSNEPSTTNSIPHSTVRTPADELVGTYRVEGVNPDGSPYGGQVTITVDSDVFNFHWRISSGQTYLGSGRLRGRLISVDWGQQYPVTYRLDDDGILRGTWANGTASEDLVPIR